MVVESRTQLEKFGFVCSQCGDCCKNLSEKRNVYLNEVDIERIAIFLEMTVDTFKLEYLLKSESEKTQDFDFYRFSVEGPCKFLSTENRCLIHAVKPFQCANTPLNFFWTGHNEYACMDGVKVPIEHTSAENDRRFLSQSRKRTS